MRAHVSVHLRCGACGGQRASSGVGPHVPLCSESVSLVVCHFAHTVIWHSSSHGLPCVCLPSLLRLLGLQVHPQETWTFVYSGSPNSDVRVAQQVSCLLGYVPSTRQYILNSQ